MISEQLKRTIQENLWLPKEQGGQGDIGGVPYVHGWTTAERGIELAELVLQEKPQTVVEIGCFGGRSTIAVALALQQLKTGKIYTIDPWKKEWVIEAEQDPVNVKWWAGLDLHDIHRGAMEAIWRLKLDTQIIVIRAASQHVQQLFERGVDILLVDGNHSQAASTRDVALHLPNVKHGGIVWMDDTDWPSTQEAVRMINADCKLLTNHGHWMIWRKV